MDNCCGAPPRRDARLGSWSAGLSRATQQSSPSGANSAAAWYAPPSDASARRRSGPREIRKDTTVSTQQKVAVVTGASQGIGAALVKAYRDAGFRVVANSRSIRPSTDPGVLAVAGDISDPKVAEEVIA